MEVILEVKINTKKINIEKTVIYFYNK